MNDMTISQAATILGDAGSVEALGQDFGATLTEAEVRWLMSREYAVAAADVVWRRSKLGLRMTADQIETLDRFMAGMVGADAARAARPAAE